jgi:4-amino-4-deoxy-L-arabinose transferase-like glycosyltransferase
MLRDGLKAKARKRVRPILFLVPILLLALFLSTYFYYGVSPLDGSDNYIYAQFAHQVIQQGYRVLPLSGVLGQKYILISGIALFYALFGTGRLAMAGFGIMTFLATLVVVYLIGRELYDYRAGLLAALILAVWPQVVLQSSSVGDTVPMALFVSLSVLFAVIAMKSGGKKKLFYFLSGFVTVIGFLVVAEASMIIVLLLPLMIGSLLYHRDKARLLGFLCFIVGMAVGFAATAAIAQVQNGNPLFIYTSDAAWYSPSNSQALSLASAPYSGIVFSLFPQGLIFKTLSSGVLNNPPNLDVIAGLVSSLLKVTYQYNMVLNGLLPYFAIAFALYLIAVLEKRAVVPGLWFLTTFLYLSFGTMSPSHYTFIIGDTIRYAVIFVPALALLISFGIVNILDKVRGDIKPARYAVYAFLIIIVLFMLVTSLTLVRYDVYSERNWVEPLLQIGSFVDTLPANAVVYRPLSVPIDPYVGYRNFDMLNSPLQNCSQLAENSYIIMMEDDAYASSCNLTVAFRPEMPDWLAQYNLFTQISAFGIDYNIYVYHNA